MKSWVCLNAIIPSLPIGVYYRAPGTLSTHHHSWDITENFQ
jgi:hypothetical protein